MLTKNIENENFLPSEVVGRRQALPWIEVTVHKYHFGGFGFYTAVEGIYFSNFCHQVIGNAVRQISRTYYKRCPRLTSIQPQGELLFQEIVRLSVPT